MANAAAARSETTDGASRQRRSYAAAFWLAMVGLAVAAAWYGSRFGIGRLIEETQKPTFRTVAAITIFLGTYVVVAIGKVAGYHLDRAGAALLGASLMMAFGVLSPEEAFRAVDFDTIALLLGMMIVVANLRLSGVFRVASAWVAANARFPLVLLCGIAVVAGLSSAFLVNDTICLVLTPLVLDLVLRLKRNPVPYLIAIATASNIGSVATITGNPQNMIVGTLSALPYAKFTGTLAPVAALGLVLAVALVTMLFPREFMTRDRLVLEPTPVRHHRPLAWKAIAVTAAMILLFFLGAPVAKVAILGGAVLLVTRRVRPEKIYREIDWPLLVMFTGLFIVVSGLERSILTPQIISAVGALHLGEITVLAGVTAVLSNIVSNVPAVLVLKPFVAGLADPQRAWLVVAMASTFAGNLTLVGSVANLIVAQRASTAGVELGFFDYLKVGAPLTLATLALGVLWLGGP